MAVGMGCMCSWGRMGHMLLQIWMQLLNTWHERQRDIDINCLLTFFGGGDLIWTPDSGENQLLWQSKTWQKVNFNGQTAGAQSSEIKRYSV